MTDKRPFDDPHNVAVITVQAVIDGAPILLVTHDADDGGWQFHTAGDAKEEDGHVVSLGGTEGVLSAGSSHESMLGVDAVCSVMRRARPVVHESCPHSVPHSVPHRRSPTRDAPRRSSPRPGTHLPPCRIRFQHGLMQAAYLRDG